MSTLAVVEEILRETAVPMSVREIVERAGARLPSKSKTPDTVVARDLSMDIKKKGEASIFIRTSPGRYTLRVLAQQPSSTTSHPSNVASQPVSPMATASAPRKPAAAAPSTQRPTVAAAASGRNDTAEGGGYAS